jgi:hypothetical protein
MRYIVMNFKVFTFFVALLISFVSVFLLPAQPSLAEGNPGSISICKIVVDENSNVVTGADKPGAVFTIGGFTPNPVTSQGAPAGVLPLTTFTTPLTYNTDILGGISGNDAQCVTYDNLPLGSYYWTEESTPADGWDAPFYSDQYTGPVTDVVSLYSYTNQLFDGDQSNDANRNLDADGNIILNAARPTRMLIVVNRYKTGSSLPPFAQTPTPGSGGASSTTEAPQCSNPNTSNVPANLHVLRNGDKATVNFFMTEGDIADVFYKEATASDWQHAITGLKPNADKFVSVEISALNPKLEYTFGVQQRFGCGGGKIATVNQAKESQPQVLGASTMAGTGKFETKVMNLYMVFGTFLLLAAYTSYTREKKYN